MAIQETSPLGHHATLPAGSDRRRTWACRESGSPEPPKLRLLDHAHQAKGTHHYRRGTEGLCSLGQAPHLPPRLALSLTTFSAMADDQGIP